jgi:hypothetical protein
MEAIKIDAKADEKYPRCWCSHPANIASLIPQIAMELKDMVS